MLRYLFFSTPNKPAAAATQDQRPDATLQLPEECLYEIALYLNGDTAFINRRWANVTARARDMNWNARFEHYRSTQTLGLASKKEAQVALHSIIAFSANKIPSTDTPSSVQAKLAVHLSELAEVLAYLSEKAVISLSIPRSESKELVEDHVGMVATTVVNYGPYSSEDVATLKNQILAHILTPPSDDSKITLQRNSVCLAEELDTLNKMVKRANINSLPWSTMLWGHKNEYLFALLNQAISTIDARLNELNAKHELHATLSICA